MSNVSISLNQIQVHLFIVGMQPLSIKHIHSRTISPIYLYLVLQCHSIHYVYVCHTLCFPSIHKVPRFPQPAPPYGSLQPDIRQSAWEYTQRVVIPVEVTPSTKGTMDDISTTWLRMVDGQFPRQVDSYII